VRRSKPFRLWYARKGGYVTHVAFESRENRDAEVRRKRELGFEVEMLDWHHRDRATPPSQFAGRR